jgi:uncharacterized membrane protein YidH (DUF202 family)
MMNLLFVTAFSVVADEIGPIEERRLSLDENDTSKAGGAFLIAAGSMLFVALGLLHWQSQPAAEDDRKIKRTHDRSKISEKVPTNGNAYDDDDDDDYEENDTTHDVVAAGVAAVAAGTLTLVFLVVMHWYFSDSGSAHATKVGGALLLAGGSLLLVALGFLAYWHSRPFDDRKKSGSRKNSSKRADDRSEISKKKPTHARAENNVEKGVDSTHEKLLGTAAAIGGEIANHSERFFTNSSGFTCVLTVCGSVLVLLILVWVCRRFRKSPAEKE